MKCSGCGTENQGRENYCELCGTPVHVVGQPGPGKTPGEGERRKGTVRGWTLLALGLIAGIALIVVLSLLTSNSSMTPAEYKAKADDLADTISLNSTGQNPFEPDSVSYLEMLADEVHDLKPPKQYKKANEALESFARYAANSISSSIAYVQGRGKLMNSVNESAMNAAEKSAQSCLNAYESAMGEPLTKNYGMRMIERDERESGTSSSPSDTSWATPETQQSVSVSQEEARPATKETAARVQAATSSTTTTSVKDWALQFAVSQAVGKSLGFIYLENDRLDVYGPSNDWAIAVGRASNEVDGTAMSRFVMVLRKSTGKWKEVGVPNELPSESEPAQAPVELRDELTALLAK